MIGTSTKVRGVFEVKKIREILTKKTLRRTTVVLLAVGVLSGGIYWYMARDQEAMGQTMAREERAERGDIIIGLTEEGTANVNTVSTKLDVDVTIDDVKVNLDVAIEDVLVRSGEYVTAGQPLFTIEKSSLNTVLNTLNNEYQQAILKLEQAKLTQQKNTTEAQAEKSVNQSLAQTANSTYESNVRKIDNTLAQYKQNLQNAQDDYEYYLKLYNSYDERTANLNVFERLMDSGKDTYEALQETFDDYNKDNGQVVTSYHNAEKSIDNLVKELNTARATLDYYQGYDGDADLNEGITNAQKTYSSLSEQLNDAVNIINKYSKTVEQYNTLEDRTENAKKTYEDAQETYNDYAEEYREMYGSMGKNDLARKVSQLELDIKEAQLALNDYELNYAANILAAENQRLKELATSETADLTYQSTLNQLELNVVTAQNKVDKLGAAISKMNSILKGSTIVAPCDGLVTDVDFAAGDDVNLLEAAITISRSDEVTVNLTLDQEDIGDVSLDQEAIVTFDAFDDQTFTGKVDAISISPAVMGAPVVNYSVTVLLSGEGLENIYNGMSCQVELVSERVNDVIKVSKRAITTDKDGLSLVKVKNADGSNSLVEVTTGFTDGVNVEILSGLNEGDIVLIESNFNGRSDSGIFAGNSMPAGGAPAGGGRSSGF